MRGSPTRREFLRAGGRTLAGLASVGVWHPAAAWRDARRRIVSPGGPIEILMRGDVRGSRVWFDPVGLLVEPGQTIRWVVERHAHTATAYHPGNEGSPLRIPAGAVPWDSGYLVNPGDAFETTLTVAGVYDYYCKPHEAAGMVGRIVVRAVPGQAFEAPGWPELGGRRVPTAVHRAFPSVDRILAEGSVRAEAPRGDP